MLKKFLITIGILVSPIVLLIVLFICSEAYGVGLSALGYYVNDTGEEVARIAAEKHDVSICRKMRQTWFVIGPQAGEQRALCIYTYAKLTSDPSACELLMPSAYGWSCLGELSGTVFEGKPCNYSSVRDEVYCNRNFSEGELTIEQPQIEDCNLYSRTDLREWCHFERTKRREGVHECNAINHPMVLDYCEYNYAIKMRDPSLCAAVKDEERRSFCTTYVSLSVKYRGN
ncbi:hypothetical protein COU80_06010 [Candidatus Peregrinibacteria bacterium CG10_big_fil_rev_8_21_14_0_10_55_24]|nr:MAG: hypothetical protein COU80_06010 [Candidatus Peregrinibacteria bacterium CG10_big_fil_rev_8_21_14_0_10_55_24]